MPYDSIEAAKEAKFPTVINEVPLTLGQINDLAESFDAIKADGTADQPMAVAVAQFQERYEIRDGKWWPLETHDEIDEHSELETVDVPNVPIIPLGKHTGSNGIVRDYTMDVFNTMIRNHEILSKLPGFKVLARLGFFKIDHNEEQELRVTLQTADKAPDGMPSIGWPERLKVVGDTLMGDYVKVPKRIKHLIKAGAFPGRSPEVKWHARHPVTNELLGPTLWATALLGAKQPSIKTLADIESLYHKEVDAECEIMYFTEKEDAGETILVSLLDKPTDQEDDMAENTVPIDKYEEAVTKATTAEGKISKLEKQLGDTQGQLKDMKEQLDKYQEQLDKSTKNAHVAKVDAFLESTKVPPAIRSVVRRGMLHAATDEVIKYSEGDEEKKTSMYGIWETVAKALGKPELFSEKGSTDKTKPADKTTTGSDKIGEEAAAAFSKTMGISKEESDKYEEREGFGDE